MEEEKKGREAKSALFVSYCAVQRELDSCDGHMTSPHFDSALPRQMPVYRSTAGMIETRVALLIPDWEMRMRSLDP